MKYKFVVCLLIIFTLISCEQKIDYAGVFEIEALDDDTVRICNSRRDDKDSAGKNHLSGVVNIPATIYGKTVVEIGKKAFYGCAHVKEFIIPSTVKTIDEKAFEGCSSLISVVFEDPYGWKVEESYHGNTIPLTLTDPRQNAKYLKNTYYLHTWQRE